MEKYILMVLVCTYLHGMSFNQLLNIDEYTLGQMQVAVAEYKTLVQQKFTCEWCLRGFREEKNLKQHKQAAKIHEKERREAGIPETVFTCNWCRKVFTQQGNLDKHKQTAKKHERERRQAGILEQELILRFRG